MESDMFGKRGGEISEYVFFEMTISGKLKICEGVTYKRKDAQQFAASATIQTVIWRGRKQLDVIYLVGEEMRDE